MSLYEELEEAWMNGEISHQSIIGKLVVLRHVLITPFRR